MLLRIIAVAAAAALVGACGSSADKDAPLPAAGAEAAESAAPGAGGAPGIGEAGLPTPGGPGAAAEDPPVMPGSADDFVINVGDRVLFATDAYELTGEAREILERQALWLSRYPELAVTVTGHADERGTRDYNLALGERRAATVRDYLAALGVDARRMKTVSYGKERPVDPRSAPEAWAKNRRAVTRIDGAEAPLRPIN